MDRLPLQDVTPASNLLLIKEYKIEIANVDILILINVLYHDTSVIP
jgi:hypothetical protein